jgi:predicted SAM-dependent methyltransferase
VTDYLLQPKRVTPTHSKGASDGVTLDSYTRFLADADFEPRASRTDLRAPHSALMRMMLSAPPKFRAPMHVAQNALTRLAMLVSAGRAHRLLAGQRETRLHLGCGRVALSGWINIDLLGTRADFIWDLRWQLPFPAGCASAVFHEHLLEHLPLPAALSVIQECHRLLRSGGILRIAVPDFEHYARSYTGDRSYIATLRPDRPTPLLAFSEIIYGYGHRSMWDSETLIRALTEAGFTGASRRGYGDSAIRPAPDSEHRKEESLYIEALKP